jgi:SAM-dependent methyltransferase
VLGVDVGGREDLRRATRPGAGVGHWFEAIADHSGPAYLRYSFTKGTEQEVSFLVSALGLVPGMRVLDVGCGPGRHAWALARRGIVVVGVDVAARFVELAASGWDAPADALAPAGAAGSGRAGSASFARADARALPVRAGSFDAAISLCQGAFGLLGPGPGGDAAVLAAIVDALRPGGVAAVSAFSAYFQVRWLEEGDTFDAANGVNHERTVVRDVAGEPAEFDLWTTCFTPTELRLLAATSGAEVVDLWSVGPGEYGRCPPDLDHPEWLMVLRRPLPRP